MAIKFKNKFIFLAHPRTGSMATVAALEEAGGHRVGPHHHGFAQANSKEITVSTIRNPYDVLATWYTLTDYTTVNRFLHNYKHTSFIVKGRIFYFADASDRFLLYDNLEQEYKKLLNDFNIKPPKLRRINTTPKKKPFMSVFTDADIQTIKTRFSKDLELYRRLCADRNIG
jgi:hypothetical protein